MADEALRRMLAPAGAPAESRRRTLALDESQDVVCARSADGARS
jgi:hypothetical protein